MKITLYALVMTFGAVVASIGLVLLFRKHEQSLSRIKLFGQEFQFSAPGLVVFLAGCAIFILFPVLQVNDRDVIVIGSPRSSGGDIPNAVAVVGEEKEPNDNFDTANIIKLGTAVKGALTTQEDRDFFKFQVPAGLSGLPQKIRVIVENIGAYVHVYDDKEQIVNSVFGSPGEPVSLSFEGVPGAYYYILVAEHGGIGEYELIVKRE